MIHPLPFLPVLTDKELSKLCKPFKTEVSALLALYGITDARACKDTSPDELFTICIVNFFVTELFFVGKSGKSTWREKEDRAFQPGPL
ncbi:MAG: hypothetical protein JXJ04_16480 [Spirochaetales bacterium]|nr:hypothetical protein [Spirochaetales bacterium]